VVSRGEIVADPYFAGEVAAGIASWRRVVAQAASHGVPVPALRSDAAVPSNDQR